ncbi:MAG: DUF2125 domain-containing protein [Proteobacteria bacterium]|nr:DUF2125 domain-containing protein [Pseudomonadota bacterium]MBS0573761.1 DUF2125 domain-containing protein [Pseudomonadota bacterium]
MRALLWTTAIAAGLYAGYWFVGSHYVLQGAEGALAQLKSEGRADYGSVSLAGFPSRFDLTIDQPRLMAEDGRLGWSAPFLQLFALSYRPNNLIAVWPHDQSLTVGPETLALHSDDLRASVNLAASSLLPLDHATLDGRMVSLTRPEGGALLADRVLLASRQAGSAADHEVALVIDGLSVDPALKKIVDPSGALPAKADQAKFDAILAFDRPLDRTLTTEPASLKAVRDIAGHFGWGPVQLDLKGDLTVDANREARGKLDISARNWRELFRLAVGSGIIPAKNAPQIEKLLEGLASQSGEKDVLKLPLTLSDGLVRFGPLPLMPLPKF